MKHTKTFSAVVATALLGLAGFAQAGVVQDASTVTVSVEASCDMWPVDDHYINVASGQSAGASNGKYFNVTCSDQLPYTVEVNTKAGGLLDVYDASTGRVYEVKFVNGMTGTPLGTVANGEAITETGTGMGQYLFYNVQFNINGAYGLPQVGSYDGDFTATVNF